MGFFSWIGNKLENMFGWVGKKCENFDNWLGKWLPSWARKGIYVGAAALVVLWAWPVAAIGLGWVWIATKYALTGLFGLFLVLWGLSMLFEFLKWCGSGSGDGDGGCSDCSDNHHDNSIYPPQIPVIQRSQPVFRQTRSDNGHSWYHQPNVPNSYGWNSR